MGQEKRHDFGVVRFLAPLEIKIQETSDFLPFAFASEENQSL